MKMMFLSLTVLSILTFPSIHSLLLSTSGRQCNRFKTVTHTRGVKVSSIVLRHSSFDSENEDSQINKISQDQKLHEFSNELKQLILVGSSLALCHPLAAQAAEAALAAQAVSSDVQVISLVRPVLDVFVDLLSFFMLARTILSWYPKTDIKKFPYSLAVWPTEPLLVPVRELVPTQFGVDISAIIWIMLLGLVRELLTGQQGILSLWEKNGL
jgi:YggT family protein